MRLSSPRTFHWVPIAVSSITLLLAVYASVCWYVVSASLRPNPISCIDRTPAKSGLHAEEISFRSGLDGPDIFGWLLPSTGRRAVVLIHGLESYSWDWEHPELAQAYVDAGFHVLLFDLRGHGRSTGNRLGLGWHERGDVRAAVDLLLARGFRPGSIGVHGGSYGAVVALLAASITPEIAAVVADSPFADVRDLMDEQIRDVTGIPAPVAKPKPPFIAMAITIGTLRLRIKISPWC